MGLKQKQTITQRKTYLEEELKVRLSYLSGKEPKAAKPEKDTIVRKLKAEIKAMNKRLAWIAENDKLTEDLKKRKAEKAALPKKWQEAAKGEKSKKAPVEAKVKKAKPEKGAEGVKVKKTTEAAGETKVKKAKPEKAAETVAAPAEQPKPEKAS